MSKAKRRAIWRAKRETRDESNGPSVNITPLRRRKGNAYRFAVWFPANRKRSAQRLSREVYAAVEGRWYELFKNMHSDKRPSHLIALRVFSGYVVGDLAGTTSTSPRKI